MSHWVLLPIRDEAWLCRRQGSITVTVRALPGIPAQCEHAISDDGVVAAFEGRSVTVVFPDERPSLDLPIPDDVTAVTAVCFVGDVLYVGGASSWTDNSRLVWYDLTSPEPTFGKAPPCPLVGDTNRPIYAILNLGTTLVAIDGAYTPKLALRYDITDPRAPKFVDSVRVPSGLDDEPLDASVGRSYVAMLTRARSDQGKAWKVALFDRQTFDEVATFFEHAEWNDAVEMPTRLAMREDVLYLARGMRGVGIVVLADNGPQTPTELQSVSPWRQSYIPVDRIKYETPLGQGKVIDVQIGADPRAVYLTIQRGGRTWWEELWLQ